MVEESEIMENVMVKNMVAEKEIMEKGNVIVKNMVEQGEIMEKENVIVEDMEAHGDREEFDDDGRPKRTGTLWTASAHIVTAVIGSGVLSLGWAMAQLGWVFGPMVLFTFSMITCFTASLLSDCYRTSDPVNGSSRNYNYKSAVKSNLGANQYWFCALCQYINLFGTAIGYTITASISAIAITRSNCHHHEGHDAACTVPKTYYMIGFGIIQIFISQVPNFHKLWWLSIVAAIMSFAYSFIAVGLSLAKVVSGNIGNTSATGLEIGVDITTADKVFSSFQALGNMAFAYSYSVILIEIEDTLKSRPAENKVMRKATFIGVSTTTIFYFLCGCLGYAAFGNKSPGNILTDSGFYEPFWLIDFANLCVIIHLVGAFQVYTQPLFAAFETLITQRYQDVKLLTNDIPIINNRYFKFGINWFRLVWRTTFVIIVTVLAITFPFFNDVLGFLGAVGFWPLTVYFPIEMYLCQKKIKKYSRKWILLRSLSTICFFVTMCAIIGSVQGMMKSFKNHRPFHE